MNTRTYVSLFSGAGVGCYGFKQNGFECIATNEILKERLEVQKANKTCLYPSGYILGDIRDPAVKDLLFDQIKIWKNNKELSDVDVLLATPPCQGMSTANYKKKDEQVRNSLVTEAIKSVKDIQPRIFIFENVRSFMKTICTDPYGQDVEISEAIYSYLGNDYNIYHKTMNFKDYGVPSSRPRTLVIGTRKDQSNFSPLNLFPMISNTVTLREAINNLEPLTNFASYSKNDIYHSFREYPLHMRAWIKDLKEGETAFTNISKLKPHRIISGKIVHNKSSHLGNKYRRLFWDKPGACINTRNDQLASQDTIHPSEDRVLSIRELMKLMTIPDNFKWSSEERSAFNDRKKYLKKYELTIRRSIGESLPTLIIDKIASNVITMFEYSDYLKGKPWKNKHTKKHNNYYIYCHEEELKLVDKKKTGSFYTPQNVIFDSIKRIQNISRREVHLLEPSVGVGNYIVQLINVLDNSDKIYLDVVDCSSKAIKSLKSTMRILGVPKQRIEINYHIEDFMTFNISKHYDLAVGNPPYYKLSSSERNKYDSSNKYTTRDAFGHFMEKLFSKANEIIFVIPKNFLNAPEYNELRSNYKKIPIVSIVDYGIKAFREVFIEIISVHFKVGYKSIVFIEEKRTDTITKLEQGYIYHEKIWLIYRDKEFDSYLSTLHLGVFSFFRDRQIVKSMLSNSPKKFWVIRSRNIESTNKITHKKGYDRYIDNIDGLKVGEFANTKAILMPNFTYKLRAAILPDNCIVNGSIVILIPLIDKISYIDLSFFDTEEYHRYYGIVRNKSRFTLNIDANIIKYIGVPKCNLKI